MGGKEIATNEQQKNKPDQPKVILKPLLKGIHGSSLAHFEVVGLIAEGNLPGLSRRAIHRMPINWSTGWVRFRRGKAFPRRNPGQVVGWAIYRQLVVNTPWRLLGSDAKSRGFWRPCIAEASSSANG